MKHQNAPKRIGIGLVIIFIGAALLLRSFGIYDDFISEYIFRWEMLLIGFGLISFLSHEGRGPGLVLVLVGGAFYLRNLNLLPEQFHNVSFWQLLIAAIFILAGIMIIFRRKGSSSNCDWGGNRTEHTNDMIDEIAVFGGGDRTIVSDKFKGGKILAVFGGSNFNLTRSKLAPGKNYIDVLAVFGGLKLVVPEDWNVTISAVSIFGGFSDKHRVHTPDTATAGEPELIIKGFVIFGGGEIKSY